MIFNNKNVLVTGHTGFKGSWLSRWLSHMGANVIGLSDNVPTHPAHYEMIKEYIDHDHRIDVKDAEAVFSIIDSLKEYEFPFYVNDQIVDYDKNDVSILGYPLFKEEAPDPCSFSSLYSFRGMKSYFSGILSIFSSE